VVAGSLLFMLVMIWFPFPALRDVLAPFGITGL
jgi:hypothetical protein